MSTNTQAFTATVTSYRKLAGVYAVNGAAAVATGLALLAFTEYGVFGAVIAAAGLVLATVAVTLHLVHRGLRDLRIEDTLRASRILQEGLQEIVTTRHSTTLNGTDRKELTA